MKIIQFILAQTIRRWSVAKELRPKRRKKNQYLKEIVSKLHYFYNRKLFIIFFFIKFLNFFCSFLHKVYEGGSKEAEILILSLLSFYEPGLEITRVDSLTVFCKLPSV